MSIVPNPVASNDRYVIEQAWTTNCGLPAVIIRSTASESKHRCGYVGVTESNKTFGVDYHQPVQFITQDQADNTEIGLKSPIIVLCATAGGDTDESIRRSLDIIINVHGGLTYSSRREGMDSIDRVYPVATTVPTWWFGYDCNHYQDDEDGGQSLTYCIKQCESLAAQLNAFAK